MVMDAQPSPQSVGREFVRQYYTLLNKAPNHLHRFYNNHSSFIHDGLDAHNREATLVIGQKNIHNKIQQLNFRDCHAKISQVDAQATLGNGVVVQVTGELSNDGQPMRRFTQTFVLAAQSPKNYYVHNDIFRYQDLYSDEENEGENRSENGEEPENENKIVENQQTTMGQPQQIYYPLPTATVAPIQAVGQAVPIQPFAAQQPQVNGVVHDDLLQKIQQPAQVTPITATPVPAVPPQPQSVPQQTAIPPISNSSMTAPTTCSIPPASITSVIPLDNMVKKDSKPLQQPMPLSISSDLSVSLNESSAMKPENENPKIDEFKPAEQTEKTDVMKSIHNEPKTYANLFKSVSTTTSSSFVPLPTPSHQLCSGQSSTAKLEQRIESQPTSLPQRSYSTRQVKDFSERRTSNVNSQQYWDHHQLFLGNVPHHATEDELKALFNRFGTVVDLRIHSKPVPKMPGVRLPPYYGFITYEEPESVQNCLTHCPLYYPDNSPDGIKLNVEEKKTRLRPSNDMPRLQNNMSNNGNMGSAQRQSGGGPNRSLSNSGGIMRGGNSGGNGPVRGSTGGPRPTGGFNRNDNRGPGGPPSRGNGSTTSNTGGGRH